MVVDEQSFIAMYDEFAPKIFKYCYFRVSSREIAEDLSAQAFAKAWDYIAQGKSIDNVQAFLYRIAHNQVIDHYRKGKESKEISLDDEKRPIDIVDGTDFVESLDIERTLESVKQKLDLLPENYREIITLRYVNDLAMKDIASAMGVSENNASVLLHRATTKLKNLLQ